MTDPNAVPIIKHVVKTGNSFAVVVPAKFIKKSGIQAGDPVDVSIDYENGTITYTFVSIRQLNLVWWLYEHKTNVYNYLRLNTNCFGD